MGIGFPTGENSSTTPSLEFRDKFCPKYRGGGHFPQMTCVDNTVSLSNRCARTVSEHTVPDRTPVALFTTSAIPSLTANETPLVYGQPHCYSERKNSDTPITVLFRKCVRRTSKKRLQFYFTLRMRIRF